MTAIKVAVLLLLAAVALAPHASNAQPFKPGQGLLPLGDWLTTDGAATYNLELLDVQANEIRGAIAAKGDYTDKDMLDFLVNVECLEGLWDTWGTFGHGFFKNLSRGGPEPRGVGKANITSDIVRAVMEEVALSEQGHALMTRQAGSLAPCPKIDYDAGFNEFMAAAYELPEGTSVKDKFGAKFDPLKNEVNYLVSVLTLEELGATGNKGAILLMTNPVLANAVAGLATGANAFAAAERLLLWERRNEIVEPFGEPVLEVFARISALRDRLSGPALNDQGLSNVDPRFINTPHHSNFFSTDIRGLTFSRTPQQIISVVTLGSEDGTGGFFPEGLVGRFKTRQGYDTMADGFAKFPDKPKLAEMANKRDVGDVPDPITADNNPPAVPGQYDLTQDIRHVHKMDETARWRGIEQARHGFADLGATRFAEELK